MCADACDVLPAILEGIPAGPIVCLVEMYVHVFFTDEERVRFQAVVEEFGARRDLDWISVDPLVPLGGAADRSFLGIPVPTPLSSAIGGTGCSG